MLTKLSALFLPVLALGMGALGVYHVATSAAPQGAALPPLPVVATPYAQTISARGMIEPVSENISVGAAISGMVWEVYVTVDRVGTTVKKGEPLFRVDDRQLQAQLGVAYAQLSEARDRLAKLQALPRPEELPPSEARVKQAETRVALARDRHARAQKLLLERATSEEDVIRARLEQTVAEQAWQEARAAHQLLLAGAWEPDKQVARAAVSAAEAAVRQIETEIERATVRAPSGGHVLQVNVRAGEYVNLQAGKALYVLGDLDELRVRAELDEEDVARFDRNGAAVAILRGQPEKKFPLRLVRIEPLVAVKKTWTGDNTERSDTRVLPVIYQIDPGETNLYVGQQVDVRIEETNKISHVNKLNTAPR
ncbi:MAG: efflux RND transporter periplasmic adaptor subunit [Pirellulales bacterium]|nr:efflux RND transporter periplasmic adaptor subunit [Pirellulales bacterium]